MSELSEQFKHDKCGEICFFKYHCIKDAYKQCPCIMCVVKAMCKLKSTCILHKRFFTKVVDPLHVPHKYRHITEKH